MLLRKFQRVSAFLGYLHENLNIVFILDYTGLQKFPPIFQSSCNVFASLTYFYL